MRVLSMTGAALLLATALFAVATPASADEVCVDAAGACTETEACLALGLCVDAADPDSIPKTVAAWVKEQIGDCACDPVD